MGVRSDQRGSAIVWALVFVAITSGLVVTHTAFMASRRGDRDARYNRAAMADTFARSGLQDALSWFHSRSNQPITVFDPVRDPHGTPPRIETLDPTIGLVREFEINGNLWGRYEVRHENTRDISSQRGNLVPGSVWELGVRAYVYRMRDAKKSFNVGPNQLVGTKALTSEIRWLQINPPAPAALGVDDPGKVTLGAGANLEGGAVSAIAYRDPATLPGSTDHAPTIAAGATVTGAPVQLAAVVYDAAPERVFGMRLDELRTYSDVSMDKNVGAGGWDWAGFMEWLRTVLSGGGARGAGDWDSLGDADSANTPGTVSPQPTSTTTPTIDSRMIVAKGLRLEGKLAIKNGLLVIDGDLTTALGNDTRIDGVVYVTGNAILDKGKFEVNGAMIVRGQVKLGTGSGSNVVLRYDTARIDELRRTVGKYRAQRGRNPGH